MQLMRRLLFAVLAAFSTTTFAADAQPLKVASWNMAWLADEPMATANLATICDQQDRKRVALEQRQPVACRKGRPFRMTAGYAGLARAARHYAFDIIAVQEVQSERALRLVLDAPAAGSASQPVAAAVRYQIAINPEGGWQKVGLAVRESLLVAGQRLQAVPVTALGAPMTRDQRSGLDVQVPLKTGPLRILVVHLKSGCHRVPLNATDTKYAQSCAALHQQAQTLNAWITARQKEGKPFMVLGDFNRVLQLGVTHEDCSATHNCRTKALSAWLDGNPLTDRPILIPTAQLTHVAGCFEPKYGPEPIDHIVLGGGAESGYVAASVRSHPYLDHWMQAIEDRRNTFYLSDHCPVSLQWQP